MIASCVRQAPQDRGYSSQRSKSAIRKKRHIYKLKLCDIDNMIIIEYQIYNLCSSYKTTVVDVKKEIVETLTNFRTTAGYTIQPHDEDTVSKSIALQSKDARAEKYSFSSSTYREMIRRYGLSWEHNHEERRQLRRIWMVMNRIKNMFLVSISI